MPFIKAFVYTSSVCHVVSVNSINYPLVWKRFFIFVNINDILSLSNSPPTNLNKVKINFGLRFWKIVGTAELNNGGHDGR